ncbi:hypothetical protein L0668_10250 [Paraglaciecola aquimarina]|uniref:ABC-three component systems C-terminal domain-containing protein n=1 Tax=Paraglaciecola algarum TaxID=3050085 RepID=A0ABS9D918_9ALTE|nr:ABC-three component system protein [Paraglaciecola sp. G1-23]MCF2948487.1 hypothetical protein [Paraglaciecola sp. G1-23]
MTLITKSVLHDATPSWNGYNYQGKIGLYVCLVNILKEAQAGIDLPSFDVFLDEHHIEYEWIEDFAIKKNENYLSLHQVKHKGENKFNDHLEAISTILYRKNGVLSDTDIFKYFKFTSKKKGDVAAEQTKLKTAITTHRLVDDSGLLDSNWKVNVQSVDVKYRDNIITCFSDFELLSHKAFSTSITYFHTADKVEAPLVNIPQIPGIPSHFVSNLSEPKSLSCQQIFLSFDNPKTYNLALSDEMLNSELEKKIVNLLTLLHPDTTFSELDVKLYKTALCALIDQNIVRRHQHIRGKRDNHIPYLQRTKPSIYFKEIVQQLKRSYRDQDDAYWNLVCRENFEKAYREQLDELYEDIKNSTSDDDIEKYEHYIARLEFVRINIIDNYFPSDCVSFLQQIYPHATRSINIREFYEEISEPQKIKSVFLDFIQDVSKSSGKLTLECKNDTFEFQPSCIDFSSINERRKNIQIDIARKGLADNYGNQSFIHPNVDYIVVSSTDAKDVIPAGIEKITEVESYEQPTSAVKKSDKITQKKQVSFMDCRKALGEING